MTENLKIPEIRYSEFTGPWEQRKLGELINLENGFAFKSEYFQEDPSDVIVLTPGNVNIGGGFQSGKGRFYNIAGKFPDKFIFKPGDIFVTMTDLTPSGQTLGLPAIVPDDGITYLHNQRLGKLVNFSGDREFLFYVFNTEDYHKHIVATASGTTVKHSSSSKILDYVVHIPIIEEQTKIGAFLNKLDNTIALHQRKYKKTISLKMAMLEKMFPKNGEDRPQIRLSEFTGPWEQRKLGELADIVGGGTPSTEIDEYWNGDIDWYSPVEIGNQIFVKGSQKRITEAGLQKSSAKILPVGTVLFTSRAGIGNTAILAKEGATNQGFQSIVPHNGELDSYFIYSRTHELKKYGETNGAGSTFIEVSGKQMAKMPILIPQLEEQIKIGSFLKQIDNTIALYQLQLEKMHNIKKAFLEKMFI